MKKPKWLNENAWEVVLKHNIKIEGRTVKSIFEEIQEKGEL